MRNKLILTDADGVLMDWCFSFDYYMKKMGYDVARKDTYSLAKRYKVEQETIDILVNRFNCSDDFAKIPPMVDAVKYVRKLHEEKGYVFHVITSACPDSSARGRVETLRRLNLEALFGRSPIFDISIINVRDSKEDALKFYKDSGCFWIEDNTKNYLLGEKMGLNAVLFKQEYNTKDISGKQVVSSWKEIYDMA